MRSAARSFLLGVLVLLPATPALAGSPGSGTERGDQVVLSGDIVVHRSEVSGDVVIVHGAARVLGTVHGDVVSLTGPTSLLAGARVKGDVWAPRGKVRIEVGAAIGGSLRRGNPLRLLAPSALVTKLGVWVAISASTLLLGFLLLLLAPRAADAVFAAVTARP